MIKSSLILLLLLGGRLFAQDLDGIWVGQFKYDESQPNGEHMFSLILHASGNVVTGKILEENTFGHKSWDFLSSELVGEITGDKLKIYKKYDGSGLQNHVVIYSGTVDGARIKGEWSTGGSKGPFEMKRMGAEIFNDKPPLEAPKF
jgi:hypothetical protein